MKGNTDCHIPNDKYRDGYDRIFSKDKEQDMGCGTKKKGTKKK